MADLTLHRDHQLGLERARKVAHQWAEDVQRKLEMTSTLTTSEESDLLEFTRPGCAGRMSVTATAIDVEVQVGMMFKPFLGMISTEVAKRLDRALEREAGEGAPA